MYCHAQHELQPYWKNTAGMDVPAQVPAQHLNQLFARLGHVVTAQHTHA